MMWQLMLVLLMCGGAAHAVLKGARSMAGVAEMMLVYVLAGYCGVLMFAVGVMAVVNPDWVATNMAQVPTGNPVMIWAGFLFLGLSLVSMMTIWLRGAFLIAPVVIWSIYWSGAVYAHLVADQLNGHAVTADLFWQIFISHGLTAVILLVLSALLWRNSSAPRQEVVA